MDQSTTIRLDGSDLNEQLARRDIYAGVHKALRSLMADTLTRIGRADAEDPAELSGALAQLRLLLSMCRHHLQHENRFVHPMIEAARAGASRQTADDHDEHEQSIAALVEMVDTLERSIGPRPVLLYRLYLRLARFLAENFEHMEVEETHNTAVLRAAYDDAQIGQMIERLHAAIEPPVMAEFMRWMIPAVSHPERVGMLTAIRNDAPAGVFDALLADVRSRLDAPAWQRLTQALAGGNAAA